MAIWVNTYGKNGIIGKPIQTYLDVLNAIPIDEVKILESIKEVKYDFPIREHYTVNKESIEEQFRGMTPEEYKAYLDSMKLPYIEIDKIVDYFLISGENDRDTENKHFDDIYEQFKSGKVKSRWEINEEGILLNRLVFFDNYLDGLSIRFLNDLVIITGPFTIFSDIGCFFDEISSFYRDYYHSYFKAIMRAFKSDFILYADEWLGVEFEDPLLTSQTMLEQLKNLDIEYSTSIHTANKFYYEDL